MPRRYLAPSAAALIAAMMASVQLMAGSTARGLAGELFGGLRVDPDRYAVLGRPLGNGDWTLIVLEQIQASPLCWQRRPDGLVDPSLTRFDFKIGRAHV